VFQSTEPSAIAPGQFSHARLLIEVDPAQPRPVPLSSICSNSRNYVQMLDRPVDNQRLFKAHCEENDDL